MNNEDFQIIKRNDFAVIINGEKVPTPEFTREGTSNFRLTSDFILQKKCYRCGNWFNVAKYKDNGWFEIWKEDEYKKSLKTGLFGSYCTQCSVLKKSKNNTNKNSDDKKDTVIWDCDVYRYVMIQAVLEGKSKNKYLNDTFKEIMKKKPIKIPLENKSE